MKEGNPIEKSVRRQSDMKTHTLSLSHTHTHTHTYKCMKSNFHHLRLMYRILIEAEMECPEVQWPHLKKPLAQVEEGAICQL